MAKIMQKGNRQIQVNNKVEMESLVAKGYEELKQGRPSKPEKDDNSKQDDDEEENA